MSSGQLIPILSLEILPGDTINLKASLFGRLATPIKPILDNLYLETFFFFTPYRQVWDNWVHFNGEQLNPGDSTDFVVPVLEGSTPVTENSIHDYMGVPIGLIPDDTKVNALPFRCYTKIYNFWFRDQNLVDAEFIPTGDGPDAFLNFRLKRRRKRRDYITSCLPFPQKGEEVVVPLGTTAPVVVSEILAGKTLAGEPIEVVDLDIGGNRRGLQQTGPSVDWTASAALVGAGDLYADLTQATAVSINQLRESFQIQKLLERDARGGTRYPEILKSHFRVTDPALLVHQRPLYLGGGSTMLNITPVQQNHPSVIDGVGGGGETAETPQGNLAGYATVSAQNHGFTSSFTEHGHIIGIVNVRADLTYQQGLERYWSRQTRFDYYWPALSHLGEQSVLNKELFVSNDVLIDDAVFGFMPRYDEYRFKQSQITGIFRSSATASLDVWHLAQDFATLPVLGQTFIEDQPPIPRVIAVPSEPELLLDVYFKIRAARPLPLYATPGLIDHF